MDKLIETSQISAVAVLIMYFFFSQLDSPSGQGSPL
jgi:hypothetical protein